MKLGVMRRESRLNIEEACWLAYRRKLSQLIEIIEMAAGNGVVMKLQ